MLTSPTYKGEVRARVCRLVYPGISSRYHTWSAVYNFPVTTCLIIAWAPGVIPYAAYRARTASRENNNRHVIPCMTPTPAATRALINASYVVCNRCAEPPPRSRCNMQWRPSQNDNAFRELCIKVLAKSFTFIFIFRKTMMNLGFGMWTLGFRITRLLEF